MTISSLSKSQYIKGLQCPKKLWLYRNRKDLSPEIDSAKQAKFDTGHEVGEYAKKIFSNLKAAEIDNEHWDIDGATEKTEQFIADKCAVLFEATAKHPISGHYSRIDILKQSDDGQSWDMIEVKSSTSVKDYHLDDIAFQYYVFSSAGYKINRCYIAVINNQYIREGDIDPEQLLKFEDVTDIVLPRQQTVHETASQLEYVLQRDSEPSVTIGKKCFDPHECDFKDYCWKNVPEYSTFDVLTKSKAEQLAPQFGYEISQLPHQHWPNGVKRQDIEAYINGKIIVDREVIKRFLDPLQYPLYFLDYETIGPAVPLFDGTKSYQAVPFQYSLHIQESAGGTLKHHAFLYQDISDPREEFIKSLINDCGKTGSIIVYNKGFEAGKNKELAQQFPQYSDALLALNERMIDLMIPFKNRWLYHPNQKSSASIKAVLPSFTDLNYSDLEIGNGSDASQLYTDFINSKLKNKKAENLFINLKAYCEQDTYAMVLLLNALRNNIKN